MSPLHDSRSSSRRTAQICSSLLSVRLRASLALSNGVPSFRTSPVRPSPRLRHWERCPGVITDYAIDKATGNTVIDGHRDGPDAGVTNDASSLHHSDDDTNVTTGQSPSDHQSVGNPNSTTPDPAVDGVLIERHKLGLRCVRDVTAMPASVTTSNRRRRRLVEGHERRRRAWRQYASAPAIITLL